MGAAFFAFFSTLAQGVQPLQQAAAYARSGRFFEARRLLERVPEPKDGAERIAFRRLKAAVAAGLGEFPSAADEMRQALSLAPADSSLLLATAAAELKAKQLPAALAHASSATPSPTAFVLLGDIEEKLGHFKEAVDSYRQAAALAPEREQYRIALASELIQHQAFGPALEALNQARETFPHSVKLMILSGIAQYGAGDSSEAVETLTAAAELDSSGAASRCLSQVVLQISTAPPDRTVAVLCGWNATVCAALQLRQARETSDEALASRAIAKLERAPSSNPVAHCALGRAYERRQRLSAARRELELCAAQDNSPQNRYALALLYQRLGLTALARRQFAMRDSLLRQMSAETAATLAALQTLDAR